MNVDKISISNKSKTIVNGEVLHASTMNYSKPQQNDLYVKSNSKLSFSGEKDGTGGAIGLGAGAIAGLVVASIITGGAATLPFLSAMGLGALGSGAVAGGMAAGAIAGDKIEGMCRRDKK